MVVLLLTVGDGEGMDAVLVVEEECGEDAVADGACFAAGKYESFLHALFVLRVFGSHPGEGQGRTVAMFGFGVRKVGADGGTHWVAFEEKHGLDDSLAKAGAFRL